MTRLPDTLRTELADAVERILAPDVDLYALARRMDNAGSANPARTWTLAQPAGLSQVLEVNRALLPVAGHDPDVTLLTGNQGSPVYMRRWWLRRRTTSDGHGDGGLYVHVFHNDDPEGFHNHPWASASLLLSGGPIFEDTRDGTAVIQNRDIVLRAAAHRHRIRLRHGPLLHDGSESRLTATTLFRTGPRVQEWGFEQPDGSVKPIANRQESAGTAAQR